MLSKAIVAPCICLATAACSGGGATPSGGVTLKGQLLSSASAQQSDPLLLAMGWYPTFAGTPNGDVIAGLSVPDPSRPPPEHSYFVVYLDGKPAANDYYSAFPLQQGYNLMEIHYDFGIDPVPLTTGITIPITNSPALNLYACQAAFQDVSW